MHSIRKFLLLLIFIPVSCHYSYGQETDSLQIFRGIICDKKDTPLPYSHIINLNSGRGSTSSINGVFVIQVNKSDSLLFRNISCQDLIICPYNFSNGDTFHLEFKLYSINEVKIFEWGSSYEDFKAKILSMPVTESLGQKLGLPQQKGNVLPNYKNVDVLKNPIFAITNPIDFLYFNLNKKQQSIQKVIELQNNEELLDRFESVYNRRSIGSLTGLSGEPLDTFLIFLNLNFKCDFRCSEIQIVSEIFKQWAFYKLTKDIELK